MIISFFNAGYGKASNAINYLLGKDADGKVRNPPAVIFDGDKNLTSMLIDTNTRKGKKYSSGAIAFRDNEKPTEQQLREVIKSFREVFCPGMGEDKVNMLWVLHQDKNNIELHFIVPKIAVVGSRTKQFNICPRSKHSLQLQRDFSAYWNDKLGYEQVIEDPIKASFNKFDIKAPEGSKNKARKERLSYEIAKRIKAGRIANRDELIAFLYEKDFKVTRQGKDYLSIKMPGKDKAIRFKGGCFVEGANYRELVELSTRRARPKLTNFEHNEIVGRMNKAIQYKMEFNQKNYTVKKRVPRLITAKEKKELKNPVVVTAEVKQKPSIQPNINVQQKFQCPQSQRSKENAKTPISSGNSTEKILISIGSIEAKIFALGQKLSQAPYSQRSEIERQLGDLRLQLQKLQQQVAEMKKVDLNKDGKNKMKI